MVGMAVRVVVMAIILILAPVLVPAFSAQTRNPIAVPGGTQTSAPIPPPQSGDPQFAPRRNQDDPVEVRMERERQKALNKERFDSLKKDTDKLLKLATELKESVDKATKDTLSLEVIRKTEEVEKLAKQVREKMKAQ